MKNLLLLFSAVALAGCSSAPGDSDIEKFLESSFASCTNVEAVDIEKTNGYEEDGNYRVKFKYEVKLRDSGTLEKLEKKYQEEGQQWTQWVSTNEEYKKRIQDFNAEIEVLYKEHRSTAPRREDFLSDDRPEDHYKKLNEFHAAHFEWEKENPTPENIKQKKQELSDFQDDNSLKIHNSQPKITIYHDALSQVMAMYVSGCSRHVYTNFLRPALTQVDTKARSTNDSTVLFSEHEMKMQGSVIMRKTENGWRALSD